MLPAIKTFLFSFHRPLPRANDDDHRLITAGVPVLLAFALVFGQIYTRTIAPILSTLNESDYVTENRSRLQRVYPVLVEQEFAPKPKSDQIRALSDVSAEGQGAITVAPGFHTFAVDDTMELGGSPAVQAADASEEPRNETQRRRPEGAGDLIEQPDETRPEPDRKNTASSHTGSAGHQGTGRLTRIPSNYRFQQDFALHYDGREMFSIAREELVGAPYFRRMIRQIREGFPLLGNWAYRDPYGVVVNEQVKPQIVRVQFLLDPDGRVIDVKIVESIGQSKVDEACVNTLKNQNFGPPPPEVVERFGYIFGINFIFPKPLSY